MSTTMLRIMLAFLFVILALQKSDGKDWCIAEAGSDPDSLQKGLDWACGNGGDCSKIQPGKSCFEPNTVADHASYAYNNYYQKMKSQGGTCNFGNTATVSTNDPSHGSCVFD